MAGTILLVDSDLIDRADWHALLQFHGYKVYTAVSGKAALDCFPTVQPDLVLIDSILADIPSDEVSRQLKANPQIGDTPIVIVLSHLSKLKVSQRGDECSVGSASNPVTRTQALDRIHSLLTFGQFHLFSESPERVHDCPECNKRFTQSSSAECNG